MTDFSACLSNIVRLAKQESRQRAFGLPGQPGEPALIEHIANRFMEVYEEIIDTAARLRGAGVSNKMIPVMDAAAHLVDTPLKQIRDFIDQLITQTDMIPDQLARNEDITIELALTLTIDDKDKQRLDQEMKRASNQLEQ